MTAHTEPLPTVFNIYPTRRMVKQIDGVIKTGVVIKIVRNIYTRCRLAEAQNWKCCWCGVECSPIPNTKTSATIEHVTPRSHGGDDSWDNLAMACARCNHSRGNMSVEEFLVRVKRGEITKKAEKIRKVHTKIEKKMRKYKHHVRKFNARGWKRNEKKYCPNTWLSSLCISEEHRKELKEMIEHKEVA